MIALGVSGGPGRESRSYTSAIVNAIETAASGSGGSVASATAAVETAAGLWARALSLASVAPDNRHTASLTPSLLAMIGRSLCRSGEIVFDLEVERGQLMMRPASAAHVTAGSGDPASWRYAVTVAGPGYSGTVYRARAGVVHLQHLVDPVQPWIGRPPWASASLSGALLAGVERQLSREASAASGYIIAMPDTGDPGQVPAPGDGDDDDDDQLEALRSDLANAKGSTVLAPATGNSFGGGPGAAPQREYAPRRFGLDPPESAVELRRDVGRDVLAACGVPPVLGNHAAPGTSMREAWRQFTVGTAEPLAAIVADQLSEALGEAVTLTIPRAADVATLARAVQSLTNAGMPIADARGVVGI